MKEVNTPSRKATGLATNPVRLAADGTILASPDGNKPSAITKHIRHESLVSERSEGDTAPEWSFSASTAGGHRESLIYGLDIPEDVEEEDYEGSSFETITDADENEDKGDNHRLSIISRMSRDSQASNNSRKTPHRYTHQRTGSTPYANDYSVLAEYSPNPFKPLPRGFQSLTTLKGGSHDTLALCGDNYMKRPVGSGERDASGMTNYTFATESDGPIRVTLHSFEMSSTNTSANASRNDVTTASASVLPEYIIRPDEPTPDRMRFPPKAQQKPAALPPRSPLRVLSAPKLPIEEPSSPRRSSLSTLVPGKHRRRNPLSLTLEPIPGTPIGTPIPSPAFTTGLCVDEHPRQMWLIAVVCVVACYVSATW
jgi:hypothetical protein